MKGRTVLRVLTVIGVLFAGGLLFAALVATRPEAAKAPPADRRPLVEVATVTVSDHPTRVEASGVVIPARQVLLAAEVGGRVVSMHPELVPGGRVPKNTRLLRIDARDYRLALEQQFAQVDRAQTELELERGRKRIAEREWKLLGGGASGGAAASGQPSGAPGAGLALREPQLRSAQAALKAAESGLERARLAVGKTNLTVPFNALVQERNVDVGQLVAPGAPLATLVGTDQFWVQVSVPVGRLAAIDIPGLGGATAGSSATVRQRTGEGIVERTGRVVRLLGDLDPAGRMARLLVEIDDPLALDEDSGARVPLLLGAYVEVEIAGRALESVAEIPRAALQDGDSVFLVSPDGNLVIREVEVAWRQRDSVLVARGLSRGDRVVVSPIAAPVAGMAVRVAGDPASGAAPVAGQVQGAGDPAGAGGGAAPGDNAAAGGDAPSAGAGDRAEAPAPTAIPAAAAKATAGEGRSR